MNQQLERKLENLRKSIRKLDSAIVTYTDSIDDAFLLRICRDELGEKAIAVTICPDDYLETELSITESVTKVLGIKHIVTKKSQLKKLATRMNIQNILVGISKGNPASLIIGVKCPLLECGLTKAEIEFLAKELGVDKLKKKKY